MSCSRTDRYKARIVRYEGIITLLDSALEKVLLSGVEAATFDTGTYGARQHVKNLEPDTLLKQISVLESQIDRYERKLCGGGIIAMRRTRYQ